MMWFEEALLVTKFSGWEILSKHFVSFKLHFEIKFSLLDLDIIFSD